MTKAFAKKVSVKGFAQPAPRPPTRIEPIASSVRRELEARIRRHINDYDLDREAHIFDDEAKRKVEEWCQPLWIERNGVRQPDLRKWAVWLAWCLGCYAGLRTFEIAETWRSQVNFDKNTIRVYGKRTKRSREELELGVPPKAPEPLDVKMPLKLRKVLEEWFPLANQLFQDIPHIVVRPTSRRPLELPGPLGYVGFLATHRDRVPKVEVAGQLYEDWSCIDASRQGTSGGRNDAGKAMTGSHKNVYRLMAPMFRDTGLYNVQKAFLSQKDRLGTPRNMRHTFGTAVVEKLAEARGVNPEQLTELELTRAARQMRHKTTDIIRDNYLHLGNLEPKGEDDPLLNLE